MKRGALWGALTPTDTLASPTSSWALIWVGAHVAWRRDLLKGYLCGKCSFWSLAGMPLLHHRPVVGWTTVLGASRISFTVHVAFLGSCCRLRRKKKPPRVCPEHWISHAWSWFSSLLQPWSWDWTRGVYSSYSPVPWSTAHHCPQIYVRPSLSPVGDLGIHWKRRRQFWPFSCGWATREAQEIDFHLQLGPTEKQELQ